MKVQLLSVSCLLLFLHLKISSSSEVVEEAFSKCFLLSSSNSSSSLNLIYTPRNPSYLPLLNISRQNLRFATPSSPKPQLIIAPRHESQIRAVIYCCKIHGLEFKVRSGGHDFEGQSYLSQSPFVLVDLINLRSIRIDVENATAWVQAGATQGELYHSISKQTKTLGFPGGAIASVGVGGFISGGGYGMLARKYGLAADTVIDARFMDVNGKILDRKSMGEDLFWAIRGGGGGSFGVILGWKIKLVEVPETVTVFTINKTLDHNLTHIAYRWQYISPELDKDLFIRVRFRRVYSTHQGKTTTTIQGIFQALFLGETDRLLPMMQEIFPELGLSRGDCSEMSWVESILYFAGDKAGESVDVLLDREMKPKIFFKAKSDYVKEPISMKGIQGLWAIYYEQAPGATDMVWSPFGGRMDEISESEIPFPHRAGNLFEIFQSVYWFEDGEEASRKPLSCINNLYSYLSPYVSKSPRTSYVNHKDLDLGINSENGSSYESARNSWGVQYFKDNFERLVKVKTMVDPGNFFRNKQSIPPLST